MSNDPTAILIEFDPRQQRMMGVARHGMTPFDVPFISELAENLWQGGCRDGLILPEFIDYVVSLYPWEKYTIKHNADRTEIEMFDSLDQSTEQLDEIARLVNHLRKRGVVLVHCQAGLNRSSLVAARALMLDGLTANEAIRTIREKRSPACLCNAAFEAHLRSLDQVTDMQPLDSKPSTGHAKALKAALKGREGQSHEDNNTN